MKRILNYVTMTAFAVPILMIMGSAPAAAGNICGPHEKIVKQLESGYEEARSGFGLSGNGALVELFVSKAKGTWTFMLTRPDGVTCLMATGGNWEHMTVVDEVVEEMM